MTFSAASLRAILQAQTPPGATGLMLGISGGLDSACLATALAQIPKSIRDLPLRAVHVDHGLQAAAAEFRVACTALCERLGLPLSIIEVRVAPQAGASLEAAARAARHAGFAAQLRAGECLLTAHHALDQAETVLLQLLRGAGLPGLSAMPSCRPFAAGWHLRPLLDVSRRDLLRFAADAGLDAADDPMNSDERFDRVYLRKRIWPLLEKRWPGAAAAVSRAAVHVGEAQALLDESAAASLRTLRDGNALSVTGLRALPAPQQLNALRHWIVGQGAPAPPTARLIEALRQCVHAQDDHLPAVEWGTHALRRYRQRLFVAAAQIPKLGEPRTWALDGAPPLELGAGCGSLAWSSQRGGLDVCRLPALLSVRQRAGGETLRPQRRARIQSVQHLCQSLGVLPWMRDALPMVHAAGSLVAVGDLWLDARWCVDAGAPGLGIEWRCAPIVV